MKYEIALIALLLAGCGGAPVGRTCNDDKACDDGLSCLSEETGEDYPEWCEGESFCSVSCETDTDCTDALGDGHICVNECSTGMCFEGSSGTVSTFPTSR